MRQLAFVLALAAAPSAFAASFADVRVAFDPAGPYQSSTAAAPGNTLYFEVRLRTDSTTHLGLAGTTFQLRIDGWHPTNTLVPWSTPQGSDAEGGPGVRGPTAMGRVAPFAAAGSTVLPTSTLVSNSLFIGGVGTNNSISIVQAPQGLSTNSFGSYFNTSNDVVVFRFGIHVGVPSDAFQISVTPASVVNNVVHWYDSPNGAQTTSEDLPTSNISPANVFFVPSPGVLAAWITLPWFARRRR